MKNDSHNYGPSVICSVLCGHLSLTFVLPRPKSQTACVIAYCVLAIQIHIPVYFCDIGISVDTETPPGIRPWKPHMSSPRPTHFLYEFSSTNRRHETNIQKPCQVSPSLFRAWISAPRRWKITFLHHYLEENLLSQTLITKRMKPTGNMYSIWRYNKAIVVREYMQHSLCFSFQTWSYFCIDVVRSKPN